MDLYEQKYNDALERAETLIEKLESAHIKGFIYHIFPELIEDEDERTRKEILNVFKQLDEGTTICGRNYDYAKWIAWLEKQKEFVSADFDDVWKTADCDELTAPLEKYSKDAIKKMCHAWYDKGIELERRNWLEKQGKQKPADMVEPKLHEGDWIISNNKKSTYQVIEVKRGIYVIRDNVDNHEYHIGIEECEKSGRLWSINDAKDGDVLCYHVSATAFSLIGIFKRVAPKTDYMGGTYRNYAQYGGFGSIENYTLQVALGNNELHHCGSIAYPATKEQRDMLFSKIKEAGYEWNAEKKELKKMEVASKEGDDERIRKAILIYLDWLDGRKDYQPKGVYTIRDMIVWVIKQDKKISADKVIEKACEWIHTALYLDYERSIEHRYATLEELLNDFKKAMKGGEQ